MTSAGCKGIKSCITTPYFNPLSDAGSVIISPMQTATKAATKNRLFLATPTVPELLARSLEQKDHIIHEQQKLLKLLEEKLRLSRLRRFGASSEKLSFQVDFFDEAELEVALK